MRKSIIVALLIVAIAIPTTAQAARKKSAPKVSPSTPRAFTLNMVLQGAGPAEVTIVATAADEGRATSALSQALSDASTKASYAMKTVREIQPRVPMTLDDWLYEVIDRCRVFSALTKGAFDITGTAGENKFQFVKRDWRRLKLKSKDKTLTIKSDDVTIDPNTFGIALRGFLADRIMTTLKNGGWSNAQVKIGNATSNNGHNIHTPWTIRLDAPTKKETGKFAFRAYDYSVGNVGTAMISPRLFPQGIVDPRTRTLVTDPAVINAIIFAADAATATAYAIATYANSAYKADYGLQFIQEHPEVKGIVIALDGTVLSSKGLGINRPSYGKAAPQEAETAGSTAK